MKAEVNKHKRRNPQPGRASWEDVRQPVCDKELTSSTTAESRRLAGKYNFQFEWVPDAGPCPGAANDNPSIFTALQEKLGLKLDSIKGPVDSLVIDHAERPSEN